MQNQLNGINYHTGLTESQTITRNVSSGPFTFKEPITLGIEVGKMKKYTVTLIGKTDSIRRQSCTLEITLPSNGTYLVYDGNDYTRKTGGSSLAYFSHNPGYDDDSSYSATLTYSGYICKL